MPGNLPLWTADATHFKIDSPTHFADGTHYHTGTGGGGSGSDYAGHQYDIRKLNADDDVLLLAFKEFVRIEA